MTTAVSLAGALLVTGAAYAFGYNHAKQSIPSVFVPDFQVGDFEDHKCLVLIEAMNGRITFAGCKPELEIKEMRRQWRKLGLTWPYRVVAEFDRELDG